MTRIFSRSSNISVQLKDLFKGWSNETDFNSQPFVVFFFVSILQTMDHSIVCSDDSLCLQRMLKMSVLHRSNTNYKVFLY